MLSTQALITEYLGDAEPGGKDGRDIRKEYNASSLPAGARIYVSSWDVLSPKSLIFEANGIICTGSFYDTVILTHKQQAWVSEKDIEIRFATSHTFLIPTYNLVTLCVRESHRLPITALLTLVRHDLLMADSCSSPKPSRCPACLLSDCQFPGAGLRLPSPGNRTEKVLTLSKPRQSIRERARTRLNRTKYGQYYGELTAFPRGPKLLKTLGSVVHTSKKNFKDHLVQSLNYELRTKKKLLHLLGALVFSPVK